MKGCILEPTCLQGWKEKLFEELPSRKSSSQSILANIMKNTDSRFKERSPERGQVLLREAEQQLGGSLSCSLAAKGSKRGEDPVHLVSGRVPGARSGAGGAQQRVEQQQAGEAGHRAEFMRPH